jgi:hypothetical protein
VIANNVVQPPHAAIVDYVWRPCDLENVLQFVSEERGAVIRVAGRCQADPDEPGRRRGRDEASRAMPRDGVTNP